MPEIIVCENCGYTWETESELEKVTCPSCTRKTGRIKKDPSIF